MDNHEATVREEVLAEAEEVLAEVEHRWEEEETRVGPITVNPLLPRDDSYPASAEEFFDEFYHYVAGASVTDDEGRLLCIYSPARDEWETPGGMGEPKETPAETARRETLEESGIESEITGVLFTRLMEIDLGGPEPLPVPVAGFTARRTGGKELDGTDLEENEEVTDVRWFEPDELPTGLREYEWKHPYIESLSDQS